jgi:5-methyltetrahydrofolate--homocysteine methyltransferase
MDDKVTYKETPEHFAELAAAFVSSGARLIGGCCGTTPEFIKALKEKVSGLKPVPAGERPKGVLTSSVKHVYADKLDTENIFRLDASKNDEMLQALKLNDISWVEDTALDIAAEGFDAIYVNVDAASASDSLLPVVVDRLQWYVRDPIIMETTDAAALDKALRIYRGVAGIVIGDDAADKAALTAAAQKYGSVIISNDL